MFVSRVPFLLLLVFPLLELYLLIKAGGIVGAWPVVLWVIVAGADRHGERSGGG